MDTTLAFFLLALVVMVLISVVLFRTQSRDGHAQATFSLGELFTASVTLQPKDTASAEEAVQRAARVRGEAEPLVAGLATDEPTSLARILWLDDNPDGNLYETVALEKLGRFVTKATSVEAARRYLEEMEFALVITDMSGIELIKSVREAGLAIPVVVYTVDADSRRERLTDLGAQDVVDMPYELIRAVNSRLV